MALRHASLAALLLGRLHSMHAVADFMLMQDSADSSCCSAGWPCDWASQVCLPKKAVASVWVCSMPSRVAIRAACRLRSIGTPLSPTDSFPQFGEGHPNLYGHVCGRHCGGPGAALPAGKLVPQRAAAIQQRSTLRPPTHLAGAGRRAWRAWQQQLRGIAVRHGNAKHGRSA